MNFRPESKHRQSIRLRGYDYSKSGAYFITICIQNRECLFGEVVDGIMELNQLGNIVMEEWLKSSKIREEIDLDQFIVMPNHVHGIIFINQSRPVGAHGRAPLHRRPRSLGSFIAGFKSAATKRINEFRAMPRVPIWQRNYYEHIIRNEEDLYKIRQYIQNNPLNWELDEENPQNKKGTQMNASLLRPRYHQR